MDPILVLAVLCLVIATLGHIWTTIRPYTWQPIKWPERLWLAAGFFFILAFLEYLKS